MSTLKQTFAAGPGIPVLPAAGAAGGRWVLAPTVLASSMVFIDGSALNVALPALQASLHASGAQLLWVVNGYLLMLAAFILVGGSLGDEFGRKRVFMLGIGLFGLASLACGLSSSIELLIGMRVVQGAGGALMIPGSLALITANTSPAERGQAIGAWSAVTTVVTVLGPVLGGALAGAGLWRGVFLINLPLAAGALLVLQWRVPESRSAEGVPRLDVLGTALEALGLAGLTYGFISAPDRGFGDPTVAGSLAGGALALGAFVLVEARGAHPLMPLGLFKSRAFSGTNLLTLFLYGALNACLFFLSLNLVQVQGYSPQAAGLAFTPFALALMTLSPFVGRVVDRYGARLPLVAGPLLAGAGFGLMGLAGLAGGPARYWVSFFPGIVVLGLGMGLTVAPLTTTVMNAVRPELAGTASGVNNAVARIAGVLAIAVMGALALGLFAGRLGERTASLNLPPEARAALSTEAARLGAAAVPAQVAPERAPAVAAAIRLAFVDTFQVVMFTGVGLAWLGALLAGLVVEGRRA